MKHDLKIPKDVRKLAIEFCAFCFERQEELAGLDSYEKRFNRFIKMKSKSK